jgi:hypothetical protein
MDKQKYAPEIESPEGLHDPEVSGQALLVQVVVGQVQNLQNREWPETTGQRWQPVHPQVQNPKENVIKFYEKMTTQF